jgi:eukaryotic-like serine/threonine-protein kinase
VADVFAGRYELIDPIGSGGNSTVWRAWDRRLQRFCAAKVLRQRHAGALLRFVREQGLRLDHPNVLSPYGWVAEDNQALLAMDLVGGGSVSSLVADFGALPERYAAELLAQLLGALSQVHAAGLVHRDVKPANLLLETTGTERPVLRLSDFGIALSLGEPRLTQDGAVVGTPGYVAPEVLAGEPPSISQDLYAAGVTGWQLLTGDEPPASGPPASRPLDAPRESLVWQVIEGLLRPEAANRTSSADDALAELAPLLAEPLDLPALTRDGEPIEVFDQLPPLPKPYAARAEPPAAPPPAPSAARAERPASAEHPAASVEPSQRTSPIGSPNPSPSSGSFSAALTSSSPAPRRRRAVVLTVSGVIVLAAAAVIAVLTLDGDQASDDQPPPSQSSTPETIPTGPVTPAPNAEVKLGGSCGWQEAGSIETTTDGTRVACRQQGSSYRWIKVG